MGCAIEVHGHLGTGLLEPVYEKCLIEELRIQGLSVSSQGYLPIEYKSRELEGALRMDLLVNDLVVVEIKSVETMIPLFQAQLLSYLKLSGFPYPLYFKRQAG